MNILWHMPTLRGHTCGLSNRAVHLAQELSRHGHAMAFIVAAQKTDVEGDLLSVHPRMHPKSLVAPPSRRCIHERDSRATEVLGRTLSALPVKRIVAAEIRPLHWSFQARARRRAAEALVSKFTGGHDVLITCQPEVSTAYRRRHPHQPIVFVCGGTTLLHDRMDARRSAHRSWPRRIPVALDRCLKHRNESAGFRSADLSIFDSSHTRARVVAAYNLDPKRCVTVYGGVDPDRFRPPADQERTSARSRLGFGPEDVVLAWTGRLSPEKNLELLIRALPRCPPRTRLLIVGDGPDRRKLRTLARSERVDETATFVGATADVRPYLHASDIFVFPSHAESFGGSVVEAMACGLPCAALASSPGGIRNASEEILGAGECGLLVQGNTPDDFAGAIGLLIQDPARRRMMGAHAIERARARFTWATGGRRLNELLVGLSAPPRRPRQTLGAIESGMTLALEPRCR